MYRIEYDISLNEQGRPYIELPEDYEQRPEDRFFALEISRYMLQDLLKRRSPDLDNQTITAMDEAERLLGQLGDSVAKILYEGMKVQGELSLMHNTNYNIRVNSVEERDALPEKDIVYQGKIYDRVEGLKVYCRTFNNETLLYENETYELQGGITNEHWKKHGSTN